MKKFKKKEVIAGGTKNNPYYEEVGEYKCIDCNIEAEEISRKPQHSSEAWPGGGRLNRDWEMIVYKCPKCKKTEKHETESIESDGSYYSNEERRAYRNY